METKKIEISQEDALKAHDNASDEGKELLENLFGKDLFVKKDITERIKTFDDAYQALGENHPYCRAFDNYGYAVKDTDVKDDKDIWAFLKLRIICAALNEGWEPQFTVDEYRYYPWFELFTQEEIDKMSKDERGHVLGRSYNYAYAHACVAYSNTNYASPYSLTNYGARLCFVKRELAEYAGKQFLDIWADFIWPESESEKK